MKLPKINKGSVYNLPGYYIVHYDDYCWGRCCDTLCSAIRNWFALIIERYIIDKF